MPLDARMMANLITKQAEIFQKDCRDLAKSMKGMSGGGLDVGPSVGIKDPELDKLLNANRKPMPELGLGANGRRDGYVNPNCPVHGVKKKEKVCPKCGHTKCGCDFHTGANKPGNGSGSLGGDLTGDEITPENFDKLKDLNDKDNALQDSSGDSGGLSGRFMDMFSKAIDLQLQMAIPTMTNLNIKTSAGTLFIKPKTNGILYSIEIATKIMGYWALCITPTGIPVSGPIISVMPTNHLSLVMPMAMEILSLGKNAAVGGNYLPLCETIVKYSRQCIWTVTELLPSSPPVPTPYPVQVM